MLAEFSGELSGDQVRVSPGKLGLLHGGFNQDADAQQRVNWGVRIGIGIGIGGLRGDGGWRNSHGRKALGKKEKGERRKEKGKKSAKKNSKKKTFSRTRR